MINGIIIGEFTIKDYTIDKTKLFEFFKAKLSSTSTAQKTRSSYTNFVKKLFLQPTNDIATAIDMLIESEQINSIPARSAIRMFLELCDIQTEDGETLKLAHIYSVPKFRGHTRRIITRRCPPGFVEAAQSHFHRRDDQLLIEVTREAALRSSEASKLLIQNIHLVAKKIIIFGKGNVQREIPISNDLVILINDYIKDFRLNYPGEMIKDKQDFLFPAIASLNHPDRHFRYIMEKAGKREGLKTAKERYNVHSLRHGRAQELYNAGVDLGVLKEVLGHKNIATTNRYAVPSEEKIRSQISVADSKLREKKDFYD